MAQEMSIRILGQKEDDEIYFTVVANRQNKILKICEFKHTEREIFHHRQ